MILSLFQMIYREKFLYKTLLGINGSFEFLKKLQAVVKDKIREEWQNSSLKRKTFPISEDFYLQTIVSIFCGVIVWWIEGDFACSAEDMAEQTTSYMLLGPAAIVGFSESEQ